MESEKWTYETDIENKLWLPKGKQRSEVKVTQSCPTLCNPMDYAVHGIFQARILGWVASPFSRGSSQPRDLTRSPTLQVDSLPDEPQRKSKDTGVGSLSLLQGTFLTQESNQGLLHCRQILYKLSYQKGEGGRDKLGAGDWDTHTTVHKIDNQQGPAV